MRSKDLLVNKLLPQLVVLRLQALHVAGVFVKPPVLVVEVLDPCRELVLVLWVFVELERLREAVAGKPALHRFGVVAEPSAAAFSAMASLPFTFPLPILPSRLEA